jgi:urease accessory protein
MASPSPGLLSGDRVRILVEVESAARLLLTAPSANRIHAMRDGFAAVEQSFVVKSGGSLDYWPEYLIPQADSAFRQTSRVDVESGGFLLWTESVAPGRTAHGEVFAFRELQIRTDIVHAGRAIARERYCIGGEGNPSVVSLRRRFATPYYASIVCIAPAFAVKPVELREWNEEFAEGESWVGCSRLADGAVVVKIVAPDSPTLRSLVAGIRVRLQRAAGVSAPDLRRVTGGL